MILVVIPVIGAPVVKSLLGMSPRPKMNFFKNSRNHLGPTQEHPGGVLDDLVAIFWTPGSRLDLVSLVKRRIRQF